MAITKVRGGISVQITRPNGSVYQANSFGFEELFNESEVFGEYLFVPNNSFWATCELWGAGATGYSGGGNHHCGGGGGHTSADIYFQAGQRYIIWVGEGGKGNSARTFGNGGRGHGGGGSGGGMSSIYLGTVAQQSTALAIAGGSGGGGHAGNSHHGESGAGGGITSRHSHNTGTATQTSAGNGTYGGAGGSAHSGGDSHGGGQTGGGGGGWFGGGGGGHTSSHHNGGSGGSGHHAGISEAGSGAPNFALRTFVLDGVTEEGPGHSYHANHRPARGIDRRLQINVSVPSGRGNSSQSAPGNGRVIISPSLVRGV